MLDAQLYKSSMCIQYVCIAFAHACQISRLWEKELYRLQQATREARRAEVEQRQQQQEEQRKKMAAAMQDMDQFDLSMLEIQAAKVVSWETNFGIKWNN